MDKLSPDKKAYAWLTFFCTRPIWGMIPLRIAFGTILILHGAQRFIDIRQSSGAFIEELPGEVAFAVVLVFAITEIVAGAMILPGLFTRLAGFMVMISIVASLLLERLPLGFEYGFQFELLAFVISGVLFMSGPGRYSLDHFLAVRMLKRYSSLKHERYTLAEMPYTRWWE